MKKNGKFITIILIRWTLLNRRAYRKAYKKDYRKVCKKVKKKQLVI